MALLPAYRALMKIAQRAPTLAQVVTAARAGALGHATALFEAGGFGSATDDAAALAVAGRLARDRALQAPQDRKPRLFAEAAAAFAAANTLDPQAYSQINQATMTWLAGERERAQELARALLTALDGGGALQETPSWLAAARAEALLLLGDVAAAKAQLAKAAALSRDDPEDHAATMRRLALILAAAGEDAAWLDAYRPTRALHFAGHLGVAEGAAAVLGERVAAVIGDENIGAGFGALAAGADLVVAEVLLEQGADLHVVLPTPPDTFRAQSVTPYGPAWERRFADAIERATSLRWVTTIDGGYQPLATRLAADVAMGAARVHARRLQTEARQLLVIDDGEGPFGLGLNTRYMGERWKDGRGTGGSGQVCLRVPRSAPVTASGAKAPEGRGDLQLIAMLQIGFEGLDQLDDNAFADALDRVVEPFRARAARIEPRPDLLLPAGNARIVAFADPDAAWHHAARLLDAAGAAESLRIVGHYGLAHRLRDPDALVGNAVAELDALSRRALPGVLVATEAFAAAASVNCAEQMEIEEVGMLDEAPLFAVRAAQ